jgi:peroxiredoxin Q/BCP
MQTPLASLRSNRNWPSFALAAAFIGLAGCTSTPSAKPAAPSKPAPVAAKTAGPPAPTPAVPVHSTVAAPPVKRVPPPNAGEMEEAASRRSPAIGTKATEFALLNPKEEVVKLSDFRGKWAVVYFYPADDTPGCTCQATEFTDLLVRFHNLNAVVVGVSPDSPGLHEFFTKKYNLKLTLLSDMKKEAMRAYGAWVETRIGEQKIERVVRSTFLIDPAGVIAWHWPEVIPEGHAERVRDRLAKIVAEREKKAAAK